MSATTPERTGVTTQAIEGSQTIRLAPNYWPFVVPALVVVGAVIVFPWAFTLWMSVNRWTLGQARSFAGLENYLRLAGDPRFWESLWHTLTYTFLSVAAPMVLGTIAALIFDAKFPLRGLLRGVFVMPMMATPVAVALVWALSKGEIAVNRAAGTVSQRGSWAPLMLMIAIFITKYTVGVLSAVRPELVHGVTGSLIVTTLYGLFNGMFIGRLARYAVAYLRQPAAVAAL